MARNAVGIGKQQLSRRRAGKPVEGRKILKAEVGAAFTEFDLVGHEMPIGVFVYAVDTRATAGDI